MLDSDSQILVLASQIVTAHVSHNTVRAEEVPDLIRRVYSTLADLHGNTAPPPQRTVQAVDGDHGGSNHRHVHSAPRRSHSFKASTEFHVHPKHGQTVFSDQLLCLECGVRMKMLKRHLQTVHGLNPREYRAKWSLPGDYPMVAADYAKLRSSLALESGLGLKPEARAERLGRGSRQAAMR